MWYLTEKRKKDIINYHDGMDRICQSFNKSVEFKIEYLNEEKYLNMIFTQTCKTRGLITQFKDVFHIVSYAFRVIIILILSTLRG